MLDGIVAGLVTGSAYAILAVCVVILYRLTGILNFSLAAVGAFGTYLTYSLIGAGVSLPVSILLGILTAGIISGLIGLAISQFFHDPQVVTKIVLSIAVFIVVLALGFRTFGDTPRLMPSLLPEGYFMIFGVRVSYTSLAALLLMFILAAGLSVLLRYTQLGVRLQAISANETLAKLRGLNTRLYSLGAWFATGSISTLALLLVAPTRNPTFQSMSFLIVPALIAALVAGFEKASVAALSGLLIGMLEGAGARISFLIEYRGALPFLVAIAALIWLRRKDRWGAAR